MLVLQFGKKNALSRKKSMKQGSRTGFRNSAGPGGICGKKQFRFLGAIPPSAKQIVATRETGILDYGEKTRPGAVNAFGGFPDSV